MSTTNRPCEQHWSPSFTASTRCFNTCSGACSSFQEMTESLPRTRTVEQTPQTFKPAPLSLTETTETPRWGIVSSLRLTSSEREEEPQTALASRFNILSLKKAEVLLDSAPSGFPLRAHTPHVQTLISLHLWENLKGKNPVQTESPARL